MTNRLSLRLKLLCLLLVTAHIASAFIPQSRTVRDNVVVATSTRRQQKKSADDDHANNAMMEEISWRAAKLKLEEENAKEFLKRLKRRPLKLPYLEARRWVQYNLGPDTKAEFDDLVCNGNMRTPYIPKMPEEHYTRTGDWISWAHFLTRDPKVAGREVPPASGRFD